MAVNHLTMSPFEELFEIPLRNGLTRPTSVRGSGVKMINMGELFAHSRIKNISMDRVPLSKEEASNYLLNVGDLLFARQSLVLSGAGKCSIFLGDPESVTYEGHIIRARLDSTKADPLFYYYYFNSPIGRTAIESIIEQVAAAGIRGSDLAKLRVHDTPLPIQHRIAHILGSLDDKIELNRQINKTLETMARTIFQSWFVDFDPVRAKAEGRQPDGMDAATAALFPSGFEEVNGKEVPKGWRVEKISTVVGINEKSISQKYPFSQIEYIEISSVTKGKLESSLSVSLKEAPSRAQRLVRHGDTIWSGVRPNRKSYLFIQFPKENVVVSTGFVVLSPNKVPPTFLFSWVTTEDFVDYLTANADGSAYPAVRADHFGNAEIILPSQELLAEFEKNVAPLRARMHSNDEQSRRLAQIRDTLLPKLMSGEIIVSTIK